MEIFVYKLTGDVMSGRNLLQRRDSTVTEPLEFAVIYIGYEKGEIEIGLSALYQRKM